MTLDRATTGTGLLTIRPARWSLGTMALSDLDTSFLTATVFRPVLDGLSFRLIEEAIDPPRHKTYAFRPDDPDEIRDWDCALVAEEGGLFLGFAAAKFVSWNRRVEIQHLYVSATHRQRGVGRRLLDALDDHARSVNARCLWLETQNINAPAVRFYQRVGFQFCGFDTHLYDPVIVPPDEIALFFSRAVAKNAAESLCA